MSPPQFEQFNIFHVGIFNRTKVELRQDIHDVGIRKIQLRRESESLIEPMWN